jgi:hypothetical protein
LQLDNVSFCCLQRGNPRKNSKERLSVYILSISVCLLLSVTLSFTGGRKRGEKRKKEKSRKVGNEGEERLVIKQLEEGSRKRKKRMRN